MQAYLCVFTHVSVYSDMLYLCSVPLCISCKAIVQLVSDLGAVSDQNCTARETGVPAIGYLPLLTALLIGPRALALEAC